MEFIKIVLDNESKAYIAGESIKGAIKLQNSVKAQNIKQVALKIIGKGRVHWTAEPKIIKSVEIKPKKPEINNSDGNNSENDESDEDEEEKGPIKVRDDEAYISNKIHVFDNSLDSEEESEEDKEVSEFQFELELPEILPSSFQHKYGQIEYYLEGKLSLKKKVEDALKFKSRLLVSINERIDLNSVGALDIPRTISNSEKQVTFCGCRRQNLSFSCTLPKLGYISGEKILFNMEIVNKTTNNVHMTKISLHQFLEFRSYPLSKLISGKTICEETTICELSGPRVLKGETKSWKNGNLIIPSCPPMSLNGPCHLINVSYYLKIRVLADKKMSVTGRVPLTIGTISLGEKNPAKKPFYEMASVYSKQPKDLSDDEDGDDQDYSDDDEDFDNEPPKVIPLKVLREMFVPNYVNFNDS